MRNVIRKNEKYEQVGTIIGFDEERCYVVKGGVFYVHFPRTGEWRPASKETCAEFGQPETKAQQDARDKHTEEFLAEYRQRQANRTPEQIRESRMEARAAMGPGVRMVNIFTGEKWTT